MKNIFKLFKKSDKNNSETHTKNILSMMLNGSEQNEKQMDKQGEFTQLFHDKKSIPVFSADKLILRNSKILKELYQVAPAIDDLGKDECFEIFYLEPIRKVADIVQLLPVAENYYRSEGGLFFHSIQVALFSLKMSRGKVPPIDEFTDIAYQVEPKYRYAAFLSGLIHEIGRVSGHFLITNEQSLEWYGMTDSLYEWCKKNNSNHYFVEYRKPYEKDKSIVATNTWLYKILTTEILDFLEVEGLNMIEMIGLASINYHHQSSYLSDLVREANFASISIDYKNMDDGYLGKKKHSIASVVLKSLRPLYNELWSKNGFNKSNSIVWIIDDEVYLRWPNSIEDIFSSVNKAVQDYLPSNPVESLILLNEINIILKPKNHLHFSFQKEKSQNKVQLVKLSHPSLLFNDQVLAKNAKGIFVNNENDTFSSLEFDGFKVVSNIENESNSNFFISENNKLDFEKTSETDFENNDSSKPCDGQIIYVQDRMFNPSHSPQLSHYEKQEIMETLLKFDPEKVFEKFIKSIYVDALNGKLGYEIKIYNDRFIAIPTEEIRNSKLGRIANIYGFETFKNHNFNFNSLQSVRLFDLGFFNLN